ncbi:hypothetical protein TNCT_664111, partial [Trichonephila clavata]
CLYLEYVEKKMRTKP